jgi:hypothetical protein
MRLDRSHLEVRTSWWLAPLMAAGFTAGCLSEPAPAEPGAYPDDEPAAESRTFYVRPSGDDANSGLSETDSWRTIDRVNAEELEPGDVVLFEAGASFAGTLRLAAADGGKTSAPVRISSSGDGRAVIEAGSGNGIVIADASHVIVEKLVIAGAWNADQQSGNDGEGVSASGTASGQRRTGLQFRELEVRGFKRAGIGLHARPSDDAKQSGYDDVEIRDCEVHDNGDFGVVSDGPYIYDGPGYSHSNLRVRGVRSHHNRGLKNKGEHTGSGIVLSDVERAVIERSVAHHNGEFNDHEGGGGFGIWAWDADRVIIQFSESYANQTGTSDGGGFDLDGGVTRSVMQFNYSHGNQGAGYGAFQFAYARPYSDNLIQYNISQNDGFSFLVWDGFGDMGSLDVVQNVGSGANPCVATFSALADVRFFKNVFYGDGPKLFDVFDGNALTFQGNDYWTGDTAFTILWNSGTADATTFSSFESFRLTTRLETLDGEPTGSNVDPELAAEGTGETLDDTRPLTSLTTYQLRETSPLIDRGVDLADLGVDAAARDFFGGDAPRGAARDVGVHEFR